MGDSLNDVIAKIRECMFQAGRALAAGQGLAAALPGSSGAPRTTLVAAGKDYTHKVQELRRALNDLALRANGEGRGQPAQDRGAAQQAADAARKVARQIEQATQSVTKAMTTAPREPFAAPAKAGGKAVIRPTAGTGGAGTGTVTGRATGEVPAEGEAFAGARARGGGKVGVGPFAVRGTARARAGAGAEAHVTAGYEDGKLKIGFNAGAALGVGGNLGTNVEVDVKKLADVSQSIADDAAKTARNAGR